MTNDTPGASPPWKSTSEMKSRSLWYLASLIEDQVRFGDTKASLLLAGDALLLNVCIRLIEQTLNTPPLEVAVPTVSSTAQLGFAGLASALLLLSITLGLLAARPNPKHLGPEKELFLFSWIGKSPTSESFLQEWDTANDITLEEDILRGIHGKSCYARLKFLRLRWAIHATIASLPLIAATLGLQLGT